MSASPWAAWPAGTDPRELSRSLYVAHETFLETGNPAGPVRTIVLESWRRSMSSGVNPDVSEPPVDLLDDELASYREAHPLAPIMPVVRRLLVADAVDNDLLVARSPTRAGGCCGWTAPAGSGPGPRPCISSKAPAGVSRTLVRTRRPSR
ncbi:hypothetical protein [Fodinicola feengrottensis]|uniref:hypothetical protein n=1 Tax=Fodinicola feengrottensis TaxID=435914 RepID=UPI0024412248|nr:hypothetical protein [Fodinicola feengrottensis]